jgi:DNA-binding CsgD family transcriptional regulator
MPRRARTCSEDRLLALIEQIYEAALDAALWPRFLRSLAETVGAASSNFAFTDQQTPDGRMEFAVNIDPQATVEYDAYFGRIDPWAQAARARGLFQTGCVLPSQAVLPHGELLRSEFYDGFGRRFGMARGISGMIRCEQSSVAAISVFVPETCEPYDEPHVHVLRRLLPHLRRALDIHQRLSMAAIDAAAMSFSLDRLVCGVIFLDRSGRVLSANKAAQATLTGNDGLVVREGRLEALAREDTIGLRRLLYESDAAVRGVAVGAGGILRVRRSPGRRPHVVVVAPLRPPAPLRDMPDPPLRPGAVVFVHDPEREPEPRPDHLARAFALTKAEARVATALMAGDRPEDVAARLSISRNTLRTHLKRLFAKTNTRRQSELVRTLLAMQPPVRAD